MSAPSPAWRVLHLGKYFPPAHGGMEIYLSDLVDAQRQQGLDVRVLVHGQPLATDPPWLVRVPVQAQLLYAPIAIGYRAALAKAIDEFKPDVMHVHMPNNSVFWALTLPSARDLPWVIHWHSDVLFNRPHLGLRLAHSVYRRFEQRMLAHCERVVTTSPPYLHASTSLQPWRHKCAVVPLGLVPRDESTGLVQTQRAEQHWTPGRLRVLSVGRLAHYKGFDTLIRAFSGIGGAELLIVGVGEQRGALERLIQQHAASAEQGGLPTVRLLGAVNDEDKNALLASCDVFALASNERTEAFGMVVLEAMAQAKPCLVSDLPGSGLSWVVGTSRAGALVPPNNVAAWREAIEAVASQPEQRQAWGEAGREAFNHRFTAQSSAQALLPVYRAALGMGTNKARAGGALLVVIPARNEARTIGGLIQRLRGAGYRDVLVIDDLSDDGTGDIARREGAQVLRPVLGLGAWGGAQTGIRYALQQGFETVITMDADGQHEVDELPTLLAARDHSGGPVDVVIGAFPARASRLRHVAWAWFRWLTGLEVTDLTSGFRCYRLPALEVLASGEATLLDYQDLGTLLLLRRADLQVIEVPVRMKARVDGVSRIFNSWLSVWRYMALTTLLCLSRWRL